MATITHVSIPTSNPPKCDFCSTPKVVACFLAGDTGTDMTLIGKECLTLSSDNRWGACEECAVLVRANDKRGLRERSVRFYPGDKEEAKMTIFLIQEGMFWNRYTGQEGPVTAI